MNYALEHGRPARAQSDDVHDQREHQKHFLFGVQPKLKRFLKDDRNGGNRWDREPNARKGRTQRQIEAGLQSVGLSCPKGGQSFRKQDQSGNHDSYDRFGCIERGHAELNRRCKRLRKADDGDKSSQQNSNTY